jgi:hypothetical protein
MYLKAGTVSDQHDSMAKAIEDAFIKTWPTVMEGDPQTSDQMKLLFVAIAEGVINHLASHSDAFEVILPEINNQHYKGTLKINK